MLFFVLIDWIDEKVNFSFNKEEVQLQFCSTSIFCPPPIFLVFFFSGLSTSVFGYVHTALYDLPLHHDKALYAHSRPFALTIVCLVSYTHIHTHQRHHCKNPREWKGKEGGGEKAVGYRHHQHAPALSLFESGTQHGLPSSSEHSALEAREQLEGRKHRIPFETHFKFT